MSTPRSERSQVHPRTIWTIGINVLGIAALVLMLRATQTVIGWVLVSIFLALAFHPLVDWLARHRIKRVLAVVLVFFLVVGLFAALVGAFIPMVSAQVAQLVDQAPELLNKFRDLPLVRWADSRFNVIERVQGAFKQSPAAAAGPAIAAVKGVVEAIIGTITIATLTIFFLIWGHELKNGALAWIEPQRRMRWQMLSERMHKVVGGYVAGTFLVSAVGGVVTAVGLLIVGNPYFLALGLLMLVLAIIPWVGSTLAAVVMVATTFAANGTTKALIVLGGYLVYQQIENELLHPLVQRHTIKMNPLLIALVLLFGTALFGVLGALLALPAAGAIQIVIQDSLARREAQWAAPTRKVESEQLPLRGLWPGEQEQSEVRH